jgi:hypothetical protein
MVDFGRRKLSSWENMGHFGPQAVGMCLAFNMAGEVTQIKNNKICLLPRIYARHRPRSKLALSAKFDLQPPGFPIGLEPFAAPAK